MIDTSIRRPIEELNALYGEAEVAKELALEERMVTMGRDQIRKEIANAREKGMEGNTAYGQRLMSQMITKISTRVSEFIAKAETGRAGRRHIAVKYLKQADPDVVSYIALRCVVDTLTGKRRVLQRVGVIIGSRIEDEVRFAEFEDDNKVMHSRAQSRAKRSTTYDRKKAVMSGYERRFSEDTWYNWSEQDRLHVGLALVDMILSEDLITIDDEVVTRKKTNKVIAPTAYLVNWIENEAARSEILSPACMPMTVPPLSWTNPFDGGYLTWEAQARNVLVKTQNSNYLTELADMKDTMPMVYDSINKLQDTRWRINSYVYETMSALWERGNETANLPQREDISHVSCTACGTSIAIADMNTRSSAGDKHACFEDETVLKLWKQHANRTHQRNVSLRSKRLHLAKTLKIAENYLEAEALFFPYQLDFRGRIYCIPSFNPQGNDTTKGLLEFSDAKPLNDGVDAGWLAIHGANVFGFDKASLEERIGWVEAHADRIVATAADPIEYDWWMDADKPFQFLAFCKEWAGFLEEGYGFMSRVAVALDGSCSGIQHFSAMLRDETGGRAVNLVPSERPQDIYQQVCDKVIAKLNADVDQLSSTIAYANHQTDKVKEKEAYAINYSTNELAVGWLKLNPNRSTTKRQVMTLPYGSTRYSCREYTQTWMEEAIAEHGMPWPEDAKFQATLYMSDLIWDSISEVVVAARSAMGWLQSCAKELAKEQLPVYWTTPVGFPVMQKYNNQSRRRVKTQLGDTIVKLSLTKAEPTLDKRRMQNAISPNVVHSLDATHLMMSVCYAADNGIDSFAMIHDSFGTHAADSNMLAACLRKAFVDMYEGADVLEDLRTQFMRQVDVTKEENIPTIPAKGTLDVANVLQSDFFFA